MSCTLLARKRPKNKWPWHFKMTVRDKLNDRYGKSISQTSVTYLEGLRDASNDPVEAKYLQEMIDALNDGEEIELQMEC